VNLTQATRLDTNCAVVEVSGDLDLYGVSLVREALGDLYRAGRNLIVVDMSRVEFMDSSGLGVIIGGVKRARAAGGELVLAGTQERETRILRVTGVVKVLPCFATVPEVFAHLEGRE
jgi:anti-sigma B factor antagonist